MSERSRARRATLSAVEARRLVLVAQGFGRRAGRVDRRSAKTMLARISPLQIDSVNVVVRAHYMPLFSRLGPYDRALLDRMAYRHRDLFEYWAHVASFLPIERYPLVRWKMARASSRDVWSGVAALAEKHPGYIEEVYREVADRGPLTASELTDPGPRNGPWWGWGTGKAALEWLFFCGRVTTADRRNFERVYDLTERVIPRAALDAPAPDEAEAKRAFVLLAARALGVGTVADIADYYRLSQRETAGIVRDLVADGSLEPVAVEGWAQPGYVVPGVRVPRVMDVRALVSPFDSLVWERARTERLFGFHYRIEIYVPEPKRVYGYYVMPFLLGDRLVARVDLKADRKAGVLLARGVFGEQGIDRSAVASAVGDELVLLASWLGLDDVHVGPRGNLVRPVAAAVRAATGARAARS